MKKTITWVLMLSMLIMSFAGAESRFRAADSYEPGERTYTFGPIHLTRADAVENVVSSVRFPGTAGRDYTDKKHYTFNVSLPKGAELNWNPQIRLNEEDQMIADLLCPGLYGFYLDEACEGYAVLPEMAAGMPEDVTEEYYGQMDVMAGDVARAWRIPLNPEARWSLTEEAMSFLQSEDEDLLQSVDFDITADDYLYSMRQLLDSRMYNPFSDLFCEGGMSVHNAGSYRTNGQVRYDPLETTAEEAIAAKETVCLDMDFWDLVDAVDAEGGRAPEYVPIDDDTLYRDDSVEDEGAPEAWISAKYLYETYLASGCPYESYQKECLTILRVAPDAAWEDVGIRKVDDYTIDLIFEQPIEDASFAIPYCLRQNWLVFEPLFEASKSFLDIEGKPVEVESEAVTIATDYGSVLEKTASCGPYNMAHFTSGEHVVLERDDSWYGYRDDRHLGMYQADALSIVFNGDHSAAMKAFQTGLLDEIALTAGDMFNYRRSKHLRLSPSSNTTKVTFNTNYKKLVSRYTNSQVLVIDEFREALAWVLNRQVIVMSCVPGDSPCFGLLNDSYIGNPHAGTTYRGSEGGMRALTGLYGITYGEGGDYATLDEACDAITGFNLVKAQDLMQLAYDKAVAAGIYDGLADITIELRVQKNEERTKKMFEYLNQQLQRVCAGTTFKDKVSLIMTIDPEYYFTNYDGNADVVFTTWGGSILDPYGIFKACYTDTPDGTGLQMEFGFDTDAVRLSFDCDGREVTASLRNWSRWAAREEVPDIDAELGRFTDYDYDTRNAFIGGIEACLLNWHTTIPLYARNDVSLLSLRVHPGCDHSVNPVVGDGGLAYMTFDYDDEEWAAHIAGHKLSY